MEVWRQELYITELYHSELYHHGVKGMKWGRRRYQNPDGSLTALGRQRLGYSSTTTAKYKEKYGENSTQAKRSAELDKKIGKKNLSDQTSNRGHKVVKNLLLGVSGTQTYNMARAAGYSKGRSAVKAVLDINAARLVEGAAGGVTKAALSAVPGAGVAAGVAGKAVGDVVGAKMRDSGTELSLQQRAIRNAYVKGKTPSQRTSSSSSSKLESSKKKTRPEKIESSKDDSSVTKRTKEDYNNLSDDDFVRKYSTTKDVYAKRVEKYGDPYMNSPLAKAGKALNGQKKKKKKS